MTEDNHVSRASHFPDPTMALVSPACSCPRPLRLQSGFSWEWTYTSTLAESLFRQWGNKAGALCTLQCNCEPHKAEHPGLHAQGDREAKGDLS